MLERLFRFASRVTPISELSFMEERALKNATTVVAISALVLATNIPIADNQEALIFSGTDGNRNWVFHGTVKQGVLSGSHREIREGRKPYESGTFEIKR